MSTPAESPRFTFKKAENVYDRMAAVYASQIPDKPEHRKAAIRFLMEHLNSNPDLSLNEIGSKLLLLVEQCDVRYRQVFSNQVMDKFWEKKFPVRMIMPKKYVREEDQVRHRRPQHDTR